MSEIHLLPTNPTTDLTSCVVDLDVPTSDPANAVFLERSRVTPSDWFNFEKIMRVREEIRPGLEGGRYDREFVTGHELLHLLYSPSANQPFPKTEHVQIDSLGEAGYRILQPIPVEIRRVEPGDFLALFREANIAISGSDNNDAFQALVAEILDTFDVLIKERNLGPGAAEQLRILNTYIVRT